MSEREDDQSHRNEEWPDKIRMSGLPFMLQGWNRVFYKDRSETSDNVPIYRLDPYTLYCFFDIIGVSIKRCRGKWIMQRDCDLSTEDSFIKKKFVYDNRYPDPSPCGFWNYGGQVSEVAETVFEQPLLDKQCLLVMFSVLTCAVIGRILYCSAK